MAVQFEATFKEHSKTKNGAVWISRKRNWKLQLGDMKPKHLGVATLVVIAVLGLAFPETRDWFEKLIDKVPA